MAKYTVYKGKFKCQQCNDDVFSLRSYGSLKELTWMCKEKHLSTIDLNTKKSRRDYEREERE